MGIAIKAEKLSKVYQLGKFSTGTLSRDIERWWYKLKGKEDPFLRIGETNDRTTKGVSDIVWSLKDINFEIEQGDAVGIIGRNGAGKSTLLKILSRVTSPTTGGIKIKGRIASLLEVGTGFHPELTGRENIFLNGAILGMRKKEIERKFDEIVDFSGVERYIDTPVKRYSSGMYVRLAFAVAAHLEPEIMIVDEVLAVGDTEFQKKCLGRMKDVSVNEGRTVLFVSHNMASIRALCDSCIILKDGNLYYEGPANEAIVKYNELNIVSNTIKIKDRKDRKGNGQLRIVELYINDYDSERDIRSTDEIVFVIKYESKLSGFFGKILIGVYDLSGTRIFFLDSESIPDIPVFYPPCGKVEIRLKNDFGLFPGKYSINVAFYINNDMADSLEEALSFNIMEDDFLGSGKLPSAQYVVIPKQKWAINSVE
jgi:lipopolysaccharide transport system ATP-binding protein